MTVTLVKQAELVNNISFTNKVGQAAYKFALEISNEAETVGHHQVRLMLAKSVISYWEAAGKSLCMGVATRLNNDEPTDNEINGNVRAVWNEIAKAMFPEG